ncbi:MAG: hypothetical protein IPL23_21540 [Saprospiraceae bacterium]|nr:hypothetical protein [Saprospiraceae bacterium]
MRILIFIPHVLFHRHFLKDVRDQGNEQLLFSHARINFTKISNGVYRLQGISPNTPDSIYALALKNITYQNTAVPPRLME